jgi:transcriptional regulator with XRE-family HTH domain
MITIQSFEIGILLRKLRVTNRFSQQHVANHLNLSRNSYANWENGKTEITLSNLDKICSFYGIKPEEFFVSSVKQKRV